MKVIQLKRYDEQGPYDAAQDFVVGYIAGVITTIVAVGLAKWFL